MGKGRDKKKKAKEKAITKKILQEQFSKDKKNKQAAAANNKTTSASFNTPKSNNGPSKQKNKKSKKEEPEEDIESIIEAFKREQEEMYKVTTEIMSDPPTPRTSATFTTHPMNSNELLLFGGEFFNGQKCLFYNDFFRYNIDKNEWKKITSPNSPGRRSSHQVVITPNNMMFLFGGEFASASESQFFHYRDFWVCDLTTNQWEKLESKPLPHPRSGHRMVLWKHYIVLFGGFYDTYKETKYFDDLWIFDTQEYKWHKQDFTYPLIKPSPRSGFQMFVSGDTIFVYGGFCKLQEKGNKTESIVHNDMWGLKMTHPWSGLRWEKRKRSGFAPSLRSGSTMAPHKNRGILFGGVHDIDMNDDQMQSVFYNDLYAYQCDTGRWYPLNLRNKQVGKSRRRKQKSTENNNILGKEEAKEDMSGSESDEYDRDDDDNNDGFDWGDEDFGDGDDGELLVEEIDPKQVSDFEAYTAHLQHPKKKNNKDKQNNNKKNSANNNKPLNKQNNASNDSESLEKQPQQLLRQQQQPRQQPTETKALEKPIVQPSPRFNAMMAIQKNTLYIYGGLMESGDREYTLNDLYAINIEKMDQYHCIIEHKIQESEWIESDDEESDEEDEEEDEEEEEEEEQKEEEKEEEKEEVEERESESSGISDEEEEKKGGKGNVEPNTKMTKKEITGNAASTSGTTTTTLPDSTATTTITTATIGKSPSIKTKPKNNNANNGDESYVNESIAGKMVVRNKEGNRNKMKEIVQEETGNVPKYKESLTEFYARTSQYWMMEAFRRQNNKVGKELRKVGFELAKEKWESMQPILQKMYEMGEIQDPLAPHSGDKKSGPGSSIMGGGARRGR